MAEPTPEELAKKAKELEDAAKELEERERSVAERERIARPGVEQATIQEQIDAALEEKKGGGGKGGLNLTSIILNVVLAVIVAYVMVGYVGITKGWFNENIAPALNSFSDTYATKADLNNYVTQGDFSQFATKDDLAGYTPTSDLPGAVDLSGYVTQEELGGEGGILARLEALEEEQSSEPSDGEDPVDAITVDLGYSGYLTYPALDGSLEQAIFFDVENNLDTDVTEVELQITLHSRGIAIPFDIGACAVTEGYPLDWQVVYVGSGMIVLQGVTPPWGDGLEIKAEDTEAVYLTVALGDSSLTLPENNARLYLEIECTDYTIPE